MKGLFIKLISIVGIMSFTPKGRNSNSRYRVTGYYYIYKYADGETALTGCPKIFANAIGGTGVAGCYIPFSEVGKIYFSFKKVRLFFFKQYHKKIKYRRRYMDNFKRLMFFFFEKQGQEQKAIDEKVINMSMKKLNKHKR